MFRGALVNGVAHPGEESLEVALYDEAEIPWDALAFPVIRESLELYYADRRHGKFELHVGDIIRNPDRSLSVLRY